jgi:hypothetical protein
VFATVSLAASCYLVSLPLRDLSCLDRDSSCLACPMMEKFEIRLGEHCSTLQWRKPTLLRTYNIFFLYANNWMFFMVCLVGVVSGSL